MGHDIPNQERAFVGRETTPFKHQRERVEQKKSNKTSLSLSFFLSFFLSLCSSASALSLSPRSGAESFGGSSDAFLSLGDWLWGVISTTSVVTGGEKMDRDETGCQAPPERPILCINNCGFFGSVATMNMCSKCYKDMMLKQEQAQLAASSIGSIVNESSNSNGTEPIAAATVDMQVSSVESKVISLQPSCTTGSGESVEAKPKEGPSRCSSCKKRVGLTGFKCRCGNLFCASHRYSDKHDCPFDYRTAARDAIAKANPLIKAEKLDKI